MEDIFNKMAAIFNPANDTKETILNRLEFPFNYSISFMGKGYYSRDGQLWGVDELKITKSKTSICVYLKRAKDVHNFENIAFIRSIPELKQMIETLSIKHPAFFETFGTVSIY